MASFARLESFDQPLGTGLVLLESTPVRCVYASPAALQVLTYPHVPGELPDLNHFITERVLRIFSDWARPGTDLDLDCDFVSGRRTYRCRTLWLKRDLTNIDGKQWLALLLERTGPKVDCARLARQYHLTAREREALHFLVLGLTNKEIADRMHVSPNTVKAFVRTIMLRMGACTRSGIVGRCSSLR